MKLEVLLVCDAATDSYGKLNVLGTFDTIYAASEPIVHAACAIVVRIRFDKIDEGKHKVKIVIADEDGKSMLTPLELKLNINCPEDNLSTVRNFLFNFQNLQFKKFGEYTIDCYINERHQTSIPLFVNQDINKSFLC